MAEELVELGRGRRRTRVVVPARAELTGVRCLSIGRMISRTECGLAVAARALQSGQAEDLQIGLNTVRIGVRWVGQTLPQASSATGKILGQVNAMDRELRRGKISKSKSGEMFKNLQNLKLDVDRLFATASVACPGGKKK